MKAAAVLAVMLVGGTAAQPQHSTPPLRNAADPGVTMPFAGLGMPCGPTYTCKQSSYEGTLTFLALGGRHTDSADSYTGAEPGIGLAMREWMASDPAANRRADLFIGSKIGPGGSTLGFVTLGLGRGRAIGVEVATIITLKQQRRN